MRRALPLLVVLLAAPLALGPADAAICPEGLRPMEDVGTVCPRENGLFEVFAADMTSLGFIHGSDPVPADAGLIEADAAPGATTATCVSGAAGMYYIQVIYARAHDDADGYANWLPAIRRMVNRSNDLVMDAAVATGSTASLHVKCVDGLVEVKNEVLPTANSDASFSTITSDLRARGYNDGKVKYWILYDDTGACGCGGQGNIYNDDRLSVSNYNNGNAGPMYAITYGYDSTRIWLHELGHNLGAVQLSAPHTSGGWHCNDGLDTMCYRDGGSNSSGYSSAYCGTEVWDCGKDSYFNAKPAASSYLASHWNIGNAVVRYLTLGSPSVTELACAPALVEVGNATTCTFRGYSGGADVRYAVDWGDGTVEHVPSATTYVASGLQQGASHAYGTPGMFEVVVSIVDANGVAGNARSKLVEARDDLTPPVVTFLAPERSTLYRGCAETYPIPASTRPVYLERGCVVVDATDDRSGIVRVDVYSQGGLVGSATAPPFVFEYDVPQTQINSPVHVYVYDAAGNRAHATRNADMIANVG